VTPFEPGLMLDTGKPSVRPFLRPRPRLQHSSSILGRKEKSGKSTKGGSKQRKLGREI